MNEPEAGPAVPAVVREAERPRPAAEDVLRPSESHLRSILSTMPDAMIVIDEHGRILSFSKAAEELFGYGEGEVVGRNVSLIMASPDREKHDTYIRRYLETGDAHIIGTGRVVTALRKDGTPVPVQLSVGEARSEQGRIFTGFIHDITERRRAEERVAALQAELIHVSRMSAMGAMASTLAHELNQPITAVVNYIEGVRTLLAAPKAEDAPVIHAALEDAAREALRAGNIVRHLRDFVARGEVDKTVESLPNLIDEAAGFGLMGGQEVGIETNLDLDPAATPVLVDRVQIQQVLINLMRNSVEAMRDSRVRLLTIATRLEADGGMVRVSIMDTGPGVAPDLAPRLFSAFVSTKAKGMGLGLSICRTIIEAHGGRIWMEPRAEGGTIFHITLAHAGLGEENGT